MSGSEQAQFVLDTNIVLYFLGNRLANPLPAGQYLVSIITEIELLSYPSLTPEEETQIQVFLAQILVCSIDPKIKAATIALRKTHRLRLPDAIVAATAKVADAVLLTNDMGLLNLEGVQAQSLAIL
ncbi:MAG TPA: type II toxin-antitoxin system VapC family toxin [Allocoleopsis sp.]